MPSFEGNLFTHYSTKLPHRKLDTPGYHTVKTRSLYLTWAWYTTGSWQTDGRTDGQTDRQNSHSYYAPQQYLPVLAVARKNENNFTFLLNQAVLQCCQLSLIWTLWNDIQCIQYIIFFVDVGVVVYVYTEWVIWDFDTIIREVLVLK